MNKLLIICLAFAGLIAENIINYDNSVTIQNEEILCYDAMDNNESEKVKIESYIKTSHIGMK